MICMIRKLNKCVGFIDRKNKCFYVLSLHADDERARARAGKEQEKV